MSYSRMNDVVVSVLLDGKPAGSTVHEIRNGDMPAWPAIPDSSGPSVWSRVAFDKVVPDDGRNHELRIRLKWNRGQSVAINTVSSDDMIRLVCSAKDNRYFVSAAVIPGVEVKVHDDGLAYIIPAGCQQRRFFFGFSEIGGWKSRYDKDLCYIVNPARIDTSELDKYHFRLIGGNRRFGNLYRTEDGRIRYYAFYGFPDRNDDYFYNSEISKEEFYEIESEYDCEVSSGNRGEGFYEKYIKDHPIVLEGWSRII